MLLTKEVSVGMSGKAIAYYRNKGYELPNPVSRGTHIMVKIEDLPENSNQIVQVQCDKCRTIMERKYSNYLRWTHTGKDYCNACGKQVLMSGENNPRWNPNLSDEDRLHKNRSNKEYNEFVETVKTRDGYKCKICGSTKNLHIHHLYSYKDYPELRLDPDNGITLCEEHHHCFHSIYSETGNTKEQFEEWIGEKLERIDYIKVTPTARRVYCYEDQNTFDSLLLASQYYHVPRNRIYNNIRKTSKQVDGKHFFYHEDFINMTEQDLKEYFKWSNSAPKLRTRAVIQMEKDIIFPSVSSVGKSGLTSQSSIERCLSRKIPYTQKNNERLHWMYYSDYLALTDKEISDISQKFNLPDLANQVAKHKQEEQQ